MYKVVVMDDEPIIVEGIIRTVPWSKYDCKVVASANDGVVGIEVIRTYEPHILFSDISMPEMDGLTMVAGVKSEFPNMQVSILTGYRNFDYAQKAIRLGVTRFLLKPSNMEEIEEALESMTLNLKKIGINPDESENKLTEDDKEENKEENVASSFIVKNAITYIKENYERKLTLSDVAEKVYVSQWHLSKLINRHMGQNFSEVLNTIRIEEAKKLLKDPALRIGDIAETVGFSDLAHFSRVFKKILGISANEYRNTIISNEE